MTELHTLIKFCPRDGMFFWNYVNDLILPNMRNKYTSVKLLLSHHRNLAGNSTSGGNSWQFTILMRCMWGKISPPENLKESQGPHLGMSKRIQGRVSYLSRRNVKGNPKATIKHVAVKAQSIESQVDWVPDTFK